MEVHFKQYLENEVLQNNKEILRCAGKLYKRSRYRKKPNRENILMTLVKDNKNKFLGNVIRKNADTDAGGEVIFEIIVGIVKL